MSGDTVEDLQAELASLHRAVRGFAAARSLEDAVPHLVEMWEGGGLTWDLACLFVVDEDAEALRTVRGWGTGDADRSAFLEATHRLHFRMGEGPPAECGPPDSRSGFRTSAPTRATSAAPRRERPTYGRVCSCRRAWGVASWVSWSCTAKRCGDQIHPCSSDSFPSPTSSDSSSSAPWPSQPLARAASRSAPSSTQRWTPWWSPTSTASSRAGTGRRRPPSNGRPPRRWAGLAPMSSCRRSCVRPTAQAWSAICAGMSHGSSGSASRCRACTAMAAGS